jgi:hypothetical protein
MHLEMHPCFLYEHSELSLKMRRPPS